MCSSKSHGKYEFEKKEETCETSSRTGELGGTFVRVFLFKAKTK